MAAHSLQRIRSRTNSSDPLLLAYLGVALVRGPEVQVPESEGSVLRSMHRSSNSERDGARLLARVVETMGWPEVAHELAAVAVGTRKDETLRLASRTLRALAEVGEQASIWSDLAEVEIARRDTDAAERASALAVGAGEPRGMRVAGMLRMRAGNDAVGAALYLQGLAAAAEDADVQPFFDDLRLLLGDDELAQWRSLRGGRGDWIRRKWEWRAGMAGVRLPERLAVNHRRLEEAVSRYDRVSLRGAPGAYPIWSYRSGVWSQPVDDRGVIYLRHGAPTAELGRRASRIAWIYPGPVSKPMVFEFSNDYGSVARPDYFLAEPPPCWPPDLRRRGSLPSADYAMTLSAYDANLGWYYLRCHMSPDIGIFGYADARSEARRDAEAGWHSESGVVRFGESLETAWNLYAFQNAGGPELVNYIAVESGSVRPPRGATARRDLGVLLSIGDPVTETSTQLDTTLTWASSTPLPPNAFLQWALPIRTAANDNARITLTLRNRADSAQGRVAATTWRIPSFDGALLLSDLVVAEPRVGIVRRGTHEIAPAPGHAVFENSPFRLYYELYGTRPGDPLAVTIRILPAKDESLLEKLQSLIAARSAFSVAFEEEAMPVGYGVIRVERDIQADLAPGAYRVVVTVRNGRTDEIVTADTNLVVAER